MKSAKFFGIFVITVLAAARLSIAGESEMLINKLAEKGIISYGEAQQILIEGKEDDRKQLAKGAVAAIPKWIQNMSINGDLRIRQQNDWAASASNARTRERLRLRVGMETRASENMKAAFGLATGGETISGSSVIDAEPTSTNHTFGNGFSKAMLMVDYAFLEYTPLSWLTVTGGKMKAGTQRWQASDLLWDTDINPDGFAITAKRDLGDINLFITGSWLIFNELNSATLNNPDAYIAQPGIKIKLAEGKYAINAAVAYEQLNVNGKNTGYFGTPLFDYVCINPSAEIKVKEFIGPYSFGVFTDMVSNSDKEASSDNTGSAYGFKFGFEKVSEFGNWQVVFMKRSLGTNAWLNKLGDSDAYGGAANSTGYEAILSYGLTKAASLNIDYYSMDKITGASASTPKSLMQFDVVYKF